MQRAVRRTRCAPYHKPLSGAGRVDDIDFALAEFGEAAAGAGNTNRYFNRTLLLFLEIFRYDLGDGVHGAGAINRNNRFRACNAGCPTGGDESGKPGGGE
jgi:hypothetical protein